MISNVIMFGQSLLVAATQPVTADSVRNIFDFNASSTFGVICAQGDRNYVDNCP
jgi:hypothetical protein